MDATNSGLTNAPSWMDAMAAWCPAGCLLTDFLNLCAIHGCPHRARAVLAERERTRADVEAVRWRAVAACLEHPPGDALAAVGGAWPKGLAGGATDAADG